MIEQRERTHTLTIEVPVHIEPGRDYSYDPLREVLRGVVPLLRVAIDDVICGDLNVSVTEAVA